MKRMLLVLASAAVLSALVIIKFGLNDTARSPASPEPRTAEARAEHVQHAAPPPPRLEFRQELSKAINLTDPEETQVALRTALEKTGTTSAEWTRTARDSIAAWQHGVGESGSGADALVRMGDTHCYQGGCIVSVTFPSSRTFDAKSESLMFSPDVTHWTGPSVRSSPVVDRDGSVTVEWVLLNPSQG